MPAPAPKWYLADDSAPSDILTFTPTAGIATAAQERHLWNDKGAAAGLDTARDVRFFTFARNAGATDWKSDHPLILAGAIELRLIGQQGTGIPAHTTSWTKMGPATSPTAREIPSDTARHIETRINAPAGYGTGDVEILIRAIASAPATVQGSGYVPCGLVGVCHGVGDPTYSALLEGGTITATGTPDEFINIDTTTWIFRGVPYCVLADAYEVTDEDSESDTLASGESVWNAVTLGAGTVTLTPGVLGTAPLDVAERPDLPEDEPLLGYVEREFDATIEGADIYQDDRVYGWFAQQSSGASLNVTIGAGIALVGGNRVSIEGESIHSLTASETNTVWLNPAGTQSVTITGEEPDDEQAIPLWRFVTDGSGVTAVVDLRSFIGRRFVDLDFRWDSTVVDAVERYATLSGPARYYLFPLYGVAMTVGANGTTGTTRVDVQTSDSSGGAFASIFTSGTGQMPEIAHDLAACRDDGARPEILGPFQSGRVKALVETVTTTPSTDLALRLRFVEV